MQVISHSTGGGLGQASTVASPHVHPVNIRQANKSQAQSQPNNTSKGRGFGWLFNTIQLTGRLGFRTLSLIDLITDVILLYKASQFEDNSEYFLIITIILFICVICPYILSYSGTIKVFLFRQTFDNLNGCDQFISLFYIIPTSIIYIIFLDLIDLLFHIYQWILLVIFGLKKDIIAQHQEIIVNKFGFDKMSWEGFKRQKSVAQC